MSNERQSWRGPDEAAANKGHPSRVLHVLLVEIADFVALRRSVGAGGADLLIEQIAGRIAARLPDASLATVGRNLVEARMWRESEAEFVAELCSLRDGCGRAVELDGKLLDLSLCWGHAATSGKHGNETDLIEQAEAALARSREEAAPPVTDGPAGLASEDALLGSALRTAIADEQLFLHYQPKLHLRRQQVTSVEALIRWHHPQRGVVMPNEFIPVAERTGDIAAMTLWTIRRAIADQRTMIANGHDLAVFINMAGALLSDAAFVDQVVALIQGSGARLGIEITETSVIGDPQGAIDHLRRLSDIGCVVTIDDYGAGLSSLAYLKQLPATELKIDKLFVTQLSTSHRDPLIVRSTIDLAHALEMEVVAEGVETPAALALLSVMGCDMVQGYLISRPLALDALLAFLRDDAHLAFVTKARSPLERMAAVRARG